MEEMEEVVLLFLQVEVEVEEVLIKLNDAMNVYSVPSKWTSKLKYSFL
jgi:hypothetical protein